jgi:hypothetical protein
MPRFVLHKIHPVSVRKTGSATGQQRYAAGGTITEPHAAGK